MVVFTVSSKFLFYNLRSDSIYSGFSNNNVYTLPALNKHEISMQNNKESPKYNFIGEIVWGK